MRARKTTLEDLLLTKTYKDGECSEMHGYAKILLKLNKQGKQKRIDLKDTPPPQKNYHKF